MDFKKALQGEGVQGQEGPHSNQMTHVTKKVRNMTNNTVQKCDNSFLSMYFEKLVFSGFSHPVEPDIWIALH